MTFEPDRDVGILADALRTVLQNGTADPGRPGLLRSQLMTVLGPEQAQRLRSLVHQVAGAAEENLPGNLSRIAPLNGESLRRLSAELAEARGWSTAAAQRATTVWACALGFDAVATSPWSQGTEGVARPRPSQQPLPPPTDVTAPPPPPDARSVHSAAQAPPSAIPAAPASRPAGPASWPRIPRQLRAHEVSKAGEKTYGAAQGYSGALSFALALGIVAVTLTAMAVTLWTVPGRPVRIGAVVAAVLIMRVLVRQLQYGALVAAPSGVEFTPYHGNMRKERPEETVAAPWSDVRVQEGIVSQVHFGEHRVQLGPRNRAFATAVAAMAGKGA
jgi:hypothetical protein